MISIKTMDEAVAILNDGGVGVIPTDTVYGLVARAKDKSAVARMYELKRRDHKPGTVVARNVEDLVELGLDESELRAVEHLWPDALSLIIGAGEDLIFLHQGLNSLAVRVPDDARMAALLAQTGPLATSSANQPGEPPAVNMEEAWKYFGDQVDFYVDGGDLSEREPSTIVKINDGRIEILRQGAVNIAASNGAQA